jgi:hypothetical protein
MQKMPLTINGVDFSALTERLGYTITYEDRKGGNSMTMQNGDEYQDIIVRKPVLTWKLDSLTNAQLASLHAAINGAVYVPVTYFDTAANTTKTAYFHGTISAQKVGVIRGSTYYRFEAPTLTMRAR